MSGAATGAEIACRTLESLGTRCVYGLPGTRNAALFEQLRRSRLRTVVPTHELAGGFMACGQARAGAGPGVLLAIPGPGFTYALTALAEAALDSCAVVCITGIPAAGPGKRFRLQAIEQEAIARPLVKGVLPVGGAHEMEGVLRAAHRLATDGEPGPVLVQVAAGAYADSAPHGDAGSPATPVAPEDPSALGPAVDALWASRRCVLIVGQGALGAADSVRTLAEALGAPILTTTSGRGIVPEDHPLSLGFEFSGPCVEAWNALLAGCDRILVLGAKLSHNGSRGFRLRLPPERLLHVDASPDVLGANYEAKHLVACDAETFVARALAAGPPPGGRAPGFTAEELAAWRRRASAASEDGPEPRVESPAGRDAAAFFRMLRGAMPRDACLVTDSGLHQMLARRHFQVLSPGGFIVPADFQSMGFALPAAIGAALARPERPVVALLGDGGMAMSGLEVLTAVRERIPLTVVVFNDGAYGLIRLHQWEAHGHDHGTRLSNPDFEGLARAVGADYLRLGTDGERALAEAVRSDCVTVVEVRVGTSAPMRWARARARARAGWLGSLVRRARSLGRRGPA